MTTITTDYTAEARSDSLLGGAFSSYRFSHWLMDTLKNMFSDPVNIHDTRLSNILRLQDSGDTLQSLFRIGAPFDPKDRKSGATPAIIVSVNNVAKNVQVLNSLGFMDRPLLTGVVAAGGDMLFKTVQASIMIITESYDGTLLLVDAIYDFLCINSRRFIADNKSLADFSVNGCTGPQQVPQDQMSNAEQLYQAVITVSGTGNVSFTTDSQGPTFRGIGIKGVSADAADSGV